MERLKRHTVQIMVFLFLRVGVMLSGKFEMCFVLLVSRLLDAILNVYANLERIGLQQIYSEIFVSKVDCVKHFRTNLKIHI